MNEFIIDIAPKVFFVALLVLAISITDTIILIEEDLKRRKENSKTNRP